MELRVENLCKSYNGVPVLQNVSFTAGNGVTCVMAPSGAGKTTLLRILLGIDAPDAGTVEHPARCGCVLQQACLVEDLTAIENVLLTCAPWRGGTGGLLSHGAALRAELETLLPPGCADKPARELSGGTRRLVEVARAVFADADVLVLDEPFAGLDEQTRRRACAFITRNLGGRALLVATHDPRDARLLQAAVITLG